MRKPRRFAEWELERGFETLQRLDADALAIARIERDVARVLRTSSAHGLACSGKLQLADRIRREIFGDPPRVKPVQQTEFEALARAYGMESGPSRATRPRCEHCGERPVNCLPRARLCWRCVDAGVTRPATTIEMHSVRAAGKRRAAGR